jgi:hypothetical protein
LRSPIRLAVLTLAALILASCVGGNGSGSEPTTSQPTPTSSPTASDVPTGAQLASHLGSPADLGSGWKLWEGFADWPGGVPGEIPDDQRTIIPTLQMCPQAGETAVAQAADLRWQAFTQLQLETPDPFSNMVAVQQFLVADEPSRTVETFTILRDGLTSCLTANLEDWELGLRESLAVPTVGDERYAERGWGVDASGARLDTRLVLVLDGPTLMAVRFDDIMINPGSEPALTQAQVDAVLQVMAARLP